jgi:D-sedoheptulose 7-phosphate isomerase
MELVKYVKSNFADSIEVKKISLDLLSPLIVKAGELMANTIKDDGKILSCGNGGSACDAQHFSGEIVNRFQIERKGLPAIALTADVAVLTAIANDYDYNKIFSRQVDALGRKNDVLFAITTSGNSLNVIDAVKKAHDLGIRVVALTGKNGGMLTEVLDDADIEIIVPSGITARVQEIHILIIHCLCGLIDKILFDA